MASFLKPFFVMSVLVTYSSVTGVRVTGSITLNSTSVPLVSIVAIIFLPFNVRTAVFASGNSILSA